jgi:hypothetical protein
MKPMVVKIENGLIANDRLYDLYGVINRNKPSDCELTKVQLMRQILDMVTENLRSTNVLELRMKNGEEVVFIGRLPLNITEGTIERILERRGQ